MSGPLTRPDTPNGGVEVREAPDLISAAKKAAQVAAVAASAMTHNTKSYAKLSVPAFPQSGEMTNWMYSLGTTTVVSGCYVGELEVTWPRECWKKSFGDLECSDMFRAKYQIRWKRLDLSLSRALQGMD